MKINQAFTILQRAGGVRAARIITENKDKMSAFRVFCVARKLRCGVPVAKIIHKKWFYGLPFYTNRHTLDPRPDTETLVSAVLADYSSSAPRILDLGTGTGCIAIALVKNIPGASAIGVERSRAAARVAKRNAGLLAPHVFKVMISNYHRRHMHGAPFDVIVSNPPYIARGDTRVDDGARHDPAAALYAGRGGYGEYETIAVNARGWLQDGGRIYLEIGDGMAPRVLEIFNRAGWRHIRTLPDLAGIERVMVFAK